MAGRLKRPSPPTRRFHVPSAVYSSPARIDVETARELIARGAPLVDVRRKEPDEPLQGALRIPPDEIPQRFSEFARDTPIVLACG